MRYKMWRPNNETEWETINAIQSLLFLADRTNGRAYATVLRLSSVCDVMYCG